MIISDITNIPKGSNKMIEAKCTYCNSIVSVQMCQYTRSTKDFTINFCCSKKCAAIRTKEILMEKYGVKNISQVPDVKEKIKKTNLEKYGSETYMSSTDSKSKREKTCLERYGFESFTKSKEYTEKTKKTNLEKYGVEWYLQSDEKKIKSDKTNLEKYGFTSASKSEEVKEKIKKTNIDKYGFVSPLKNPEILSKSIDKLKLNWGVDNPLKSEIIKEKVKETNIEKYGFPYPIQSKDIIEKRKSNYISKFGVENSSQNEKVRLENYEIAKHQSYIKYVGKSISLFNCEECNLDFEINGDNFYSRLKNNVKLCTICNPIGDQRSTKENDLYKFIQEKYKGEIIQSYRDGLEIDIYLPESKLGFEFNGLYFHSDKFRNKEYHLEKMNYFKDKDIRIVNIWEDDWIFKKNIIESQIQNFLGLSEKIYARKCTVKEITDIKIARDFLELNHIQGEYPNIKKAYGLFHEQSLVSVMTFDHFEGRKKMNNDEWNLSRFSNTLNLSVIGGASKLLSYFINSENPSRIISYADKDWSQGKIYETLGFNKIHETKPDYKYIIEGKRKHKSGFKKSLTGISESKLELPKIWDCGKIKFEKIIKTPLE
jgi:hypothetical protein